MRDKLPEMLRAAAREWREKNKFVGVGETRYDVALEEVADAMGVEQEGGRRCALRIVKDAAIVNAKCGRVVISPRTTTL